VRERDEGAKAAVTNSSGRSGPALTEEDLALLRERLLRRAYLFDDPDAY
jgi:hypothetical protein